MQAKRCSRREALTFLGAGAIALAACGSSNKASTATSTSNSTSSPSTTSTSASASNAVGSTLTPAMFDDAASCALTPSQTEGPYYIDVDKIRRDIREDREGTRLRVGVRVVDTDGCTPIDDAVLEIWHCDAGGIYSGFEAASTGQSGGPGGGGPTDAERFLRGAQVTNADGIAEIVTIYPGWYRGRTVHIHAKVFVSNTDVLTTQMYFDDDVSTRVFRAAPYARHSGRDAFNDDDSIFSPDTIMTVRDDGDGYLGLLTITVNA